MLAFDITPTMVAPYEEKRGREETAVREGAEQRRRGFEETFFVGSSGQVPRLKRQADSTATSAELLAAPAQSVDNRGAEDDDAVLKARDVRLALLARKYEGTASVEDIARLQILTERMRRLSPRVTSKDIEQVGIIVSDAEAIATRLSAVKQKFGLR